MGEQFFFPVSHLLSSRSALAVRSGSSLSPTSSSSSSSSSTFPGNIQTNQFNLNRRRVQITLILKSLHKHRNNNSASLIAVLLQYPTNTVISQSLEMTSGMTYPLLRRPRHLAAQVNTLGRHPRLPRHEKTKLRHNASDVEHVPLYAKMKLSDPEQASNLQYSIYWRTVQCGSECELRNAAWVQCPLVVRV